MQPRVFSQEEAEGDLTMDKQGDGEVPTGAEPGVLPHRWREAGGLQKLEDAERTPPGAPAGSVALTMPQVQPGKTDFSFPASNMLRGRYRGIMSAVDSHVVQN